MRYSHATHVLSIAVVPNAPEPTPRDELLALMDEVRAATTGTMETSLLALLRGAVKNLDAGDEGGAIDKLTSFVARVNAQAGKKISTDTASALVAHAESIIGSLQTTG